MTLFLYPAAVLADCIMWSVIRPDGRELWGQLLHVGHDPMTLARAALPSAEIIECARDDERVIRAQEEGFK